MRFYWFVLLMVLGGSGSAQAELKPMSERAMSEVTGREFFVAEHFDGNAADNNPDNYNQFDYYRLMLNANLELNANIERLQLGCGGINDALDPSVCDVDMEHVRLMGRGDDSGNPLSAGDEGSLFELTRPYLEFAIKNDDSKVNREVVGVKLGAQSADGYMGVGRRFPQGQNGCTDANEGPEAAACHSGLNAISGYLNTEMSATFDAEILGGALGSIESCFGNTTSITEGNDCGPSDTFTTQFIGTRMKNITLLNKTLKADAIGLDITAHADVFEQLKFIHGFALADTSDFAMSFQRERVLYPGFEGNFPSIAVGQGANDYPGYEGAPANTGWWFNVPYAAVTEAKGATSLSLDALSEGLNAVDADLGQAPPDNCFGTAEFC